MGAVVRREGRSPDRSATARPKSRGRLSAQHVGLRGAVGHRPALGEGLGHPGVLLDHLAGEVHVLLQRADQLGALAPDGLAVLVVGGAGQTGLDVGDLAAAALHEGAAVVGDLARDGELPGRVLVDVVGGLAQVAAGFLLPALAKAAAGALGHLPIAKVGDASGLYNLSRNLGGAIGMEATARSPKDGYTIMLASGSMLTVNPSLYKKLPVNYLLHRFLGL